MEALSRGERGDPPYGRSFNICYLSSVSDTSKKPQSDFHIFIWDTRFQPVSAPRSCTRDEGRPLGAGLQGQAPNHLKLLPVKAGGGER